MAGVTLGILGVTGWIGFAYYLLMHLLVRVLQRLRVCVHLCFVKSCVLQVAGLLYTKATGSLTSYHPTR